MNQLPQEIIDMIVREIQVARARPGKLSPNGYGKLSMLRYLGLGSTE